MTDSIFKNQCEGGKCAIRRKSKGQIEAEKKAQALQEAKSAE